MKEDIECEDRCFDGEQQHNMGWFWLKIGIITTIYVSQGCR